MATFLSAEDAVALIPDGATVTLSANGGGMLEPDVVLAALRQRFEKNGSPRGLTLVHALGVGDRHEKGTNAFAHPELTHRVIGGHWTWSPELVRLANENQIAAYALPAGVISLLLREVGSRRPGLVTRTGLDTFADPRHGGGAFNDRARQAGALVEVLELDGREYLRYKPIPVDVAIIRADTIDPAGNLSCAREAATLDVLAAASAARASGGKVIAQVKNVSQAKIEPHLVHVPGALVDVVVHAPQQWQLYTGEYDPAFCGPADAHVEPVLTDPVRTLIALRAAREVRPGTLLNVGFGVSSLVVDVLAAQGLLDDVTLAIEQGMIGGVPVSGDLFGAVRSPGAVLPSTTQFDLFGSGALDLACLGMAQADATGSVNVSKINGSMVGPGGFVDIAQNAASAVFCGTFTAKGLRVAVHDDRIEIEQDGSVPKFVRAVEEITHSGPLAAAEGRGVTFVTERAVFRLGVDGVELVEVAPGIDVQRDVLDKMEFRPLIRDVQLMDASLFATARRLASQVRV